MLFSITYHRPRIWTKKFRNIFCKYEMSRTQRFILGIKWCWLCAQLGNIETFPTKWVSQFYNSLAPLLSKKTDALKRIWYFFQNISLSSIIIICWKLKMYTNKACVLRWQHFCFAAPHKLGRHNFNCTKQKSILIAFNSIFPITFLFVKINYFA